jgi:NAD(P)-dependent dehydrogenase (short-subunit alcohol dehydrogenase family)
VAKRAIITGSDSGIGKASAVALARAGCTSVYGCQGMHKPVRIAGPPLRGGIVLDHIGLNVRDFEASKRFYDQALEPLGWAVVMEFPGVCGYGYTGKPFFWIGERGEVSAPVHVALAGREAVCHTPE